jgi:hypothetical protein
MSSLSSAPCWLAFAAALMLQACGGGGAPSVAPTLPTPVPQSPAPSPTPAPAPTPAPVPAPLPAPSPSTGQAAVTAVGEAHGPVVAQADIGPEGGRLDLPADELSIVVPPGAFVRRHTLAIQPIRNTAPGALGQAWRITPEGVTFAKPVIIEWRPSERERASAARLRIASQGADGAWRIARASTDSGGVLRTTTTHFSDWSQVAGVQLRPGSAGVRVGEALQLSISECKHQVDPHDPHLVSLVLACEEHGLSELGANDWAVNGVPGGNAGLGTITQVVDARLVASGMYRAPASVPSSNPVAVSVGFLEGLNTPPVTLVANLNIVDPNAGCGWLQGVSALAAEMTVQYGWAGANATDAGRNTAAINVRGRLPRAAFSPIGQVWFEGTMGQGQIEVDYLATSHLDGSTQSVAAKGEPSAVDAVPVRAMFDLSSCKLMLVAQALRWGTRTSRSPEGTRVEQVLTGGAVFVTEWKLNGQRQFTDEGAYEAGHLELHPTARIKRFEPLNTPGSFEGVIGQASVRWSLVPQ